MGFMENKSGNSNQFIEMKFYEFKFKKFRQECIRKGANWRIASNHNNTVFKMQSVLYHLESLSLRYKDFLDQQPIDGVQSVYGLTSPLKDTILFEFSACIFSLWSAFESLLHEINAFYKLGLSDDGEKKSTSKKQKLVSYGNVKSELQRKYKDFEITKLFDNLDSCKNVTIKHDNVWFCYLRRIRNTITHRQIVTKDSEEINGAELSLFIHTPKKNKTKNMLIKILKRKIAFNIDSPKFESVDVEIEKYCKFTFQKCYEFIEEAYHHMSLDIVSNKIIS